MPQPDQPQKRWSTVTPDHQWTLRMKAMKAEGKTKSD
jgi:hypothetical protein